MSHATHPDKDKDSQPKLDMGAAKSFAEKAMGPFALALLRASGIEEYQKDQDSDSQLVVLDLMCGLGILTAHLQRLLASSTSPFRPPSEPAANRFKVVACDISPPMVDAMTARIQREGWTGFTAEVGDAQDCTFTTDSFDYVFCHFGPSVVPRPHDVLRECFRMLKVGGTFAFTTWEGTGWTEEARSAFASIPGVPPFPGRDEYLALFSPGDWHVEAYVREALRQVGFVDVRVENVKNTTSVTVDEFLGVFPISIGMTIERAWSDEQKKQLGPGLYPAVAEYLKRKYGEGGAMTWDDWGAYTVVAKKP